MTSVENSSNELARQLLVNVLKVDIEKEVEKRLQDRTKTVALKGFRRGKVPLDKVRQIYGKQIEKDVITNQVNEKFNFEVKEKNLTVVGLPQFNFHADLKDSLQFQASFEIFPDVKFADPATFELTRFTTSITDEEVERTLDILVKQRATYIDIFELQKGENKNLDDSDKKEDQKPVGIDTNLLNSPKDCCASLYDRVTVNFTGTIDGKEFEGGKSDGFVFVLGQNQLLPEFTNAVIDMQVGETKAFDLIFPENYPISDLSSKKAKFILDLVKLEKARFPKIDASFASSLGIEDGDCTKMYEEIRQNLILEANRRTQVSLKKQVMDHLYNSASFPVPNALIIQDQYRLQKMAKKNAADSKITHENNSQLDDIGIFYSSAERRVKLGIVLNHIIEKYELKAKPEKIREIIEGLARNYKNPEEVINWYYSNKMKMIEIESLAAEDNVVDFICKQAQIVEKIVSFEELAKLGL